MAEGISSCRSSHSVDATVERLLKLLAERSIKVFAVIDHAGEARAAGLHMRPTQVVVFGSPLAGTPVMLAAPSAALDLPLRILVAERDDGVVELSWNDPEWLQKRHGFPRELAAKIAAAAGLAARAAEA